MMLREKIPRKKSQLEVCGMAMQTCCNVLGAANPVTFQPHSHLKINMENNLPIVSLYDVQISVFLQKMASFQRKFARCNTFVKFS